MEYTIGRIMRGLATTVRELRVRSDLHAQDESPVSRVPTFRREISNGSLSLSLRQICFYF